jgi:hypothetical protein
MSVAGEHEQPLGADLPPPWLAREDTPRPPARPTPISLTQVQLADLPISGPHRGIEVMAWVPFTDGQHRHLRAHADAWTSRAVRIRWRHADDLQEVWVWANAVQRWRPPLRQGPPPWLADADHTADSHRERPR